MQRGLVLGKFMPIHTGHIELIEYALQFCDILIVWVCVSNKETMSGDLRLNWVKEIFKNNKKVQPTLYEYNEDELPNTSTSSETVSKVWSEIIKQQLPKIDLIISSEKYGDYVAEYLGVQHQYYQTLKQISATNIRQSPYENWHFIPDIVKPYYYKKISILGTESTGKSTLTKKLSEYFNADFVAETAREIVDNSTTCHPKDLLKIAKEHAIHIQEKGNALNKMLFLDTDILITKSYSKFLFNKVLHVEPWIEEANQCDLYLYLENDAPYTQDGTRLAESERNKLNEFHKTELKNANIDYFLITGNWNERLSKAINIIINAIK